MTISDQTKRIFYEDGETAGWAAFWKEQAARLKEEIIQTNPDNAKEIHRIQKQIGLFEVEFPRVRNTISDYAAQRAVQPVSAGA